MRSRRAEGLIGQWTRASVAALCCGTLVTACAPTITEVGRRTLQAKVEVESTPAGATVVVDDQARGQTPTTVTLPYTVIEETVTSNDQYGGGLLGIIGGALLSLGGVMLVIFAKDIDEAGNSTKDDPGVGVIAGYGVGLGLAGIGAVAAGIYAIVTATKKRVRVTPDYLELGLSVPGSGLHKVRVQGSGTPPPYDRLKKLSFDAASRSWLAPGKPKALHLKMRQATGTRPPSSFAPRPVDIAPRPAPPRSTPPKKPGGPEEPGLETPAP